MNIPVQENCWTLTEKEKQTLRLIVRGHDAKSIARRLGLSVHTINERLRDARRKMAVSSSREAARLLLEVESVSSRSLDPHFLGDAEIGGDAGPTWMNDASVPASGVKRLHRHPWIIIGVLIMTLALGLLALTALPDVAPTAQPTSIAPSEAPSSEVVDSARQWLTLVDQGRWQESYRATGAAFRKLNTAPVWAEVNEKGRVPLGAVISRVFASQQSLPAPPMGYQVVKFRTHFANKPEALETVTLEQENGRWHVVGVTIE
ncbi:DUF4019 domain-containing protein [Sphingosinicella rhizophila]|uniref:DUF4019 domain-containing protein n=1 Tax=Sphingosinicella rhizophila TaxID=3050082 RepID=A0ABU3QBU9_9SPHN|nr:DUF4019 domain-containing protein [Sphingosinicella sp. GR2756]MDT9600478.1 DUF4019 domain-containing protein [Sphingosinicella sp. GR2756]